MKSIKLSAAQPTLPRWAGGVVLVAAILLYLFTLDNDLRPDELTGGDLITHQYAQVEARPSNAPGYPLYTMGGWLWFQTGRILLGWALNPIQILSLYSTWWGLASLGILYLILLKVVDRQWPLAMLLTAFYATTYFFWYYSVTTEQYTSAVFQTLLVIWLAFEWDESRRDSTLLWLAFISGTMLANMVTTLFILPPLLWFILFRREAISFFKRPKLILQAIGLALLPLLSYAYIYMRGAQHPEWRGAGEWPTTWRWFVQFITIQQGRDELAPGLNLQNIFTAEFPALMWQELTWLVFLGGLVGLAFLGRRRAIFLYSTLAIYFIFSWGYRFGNWFQVIIPAYPIFIIGFAAGVQRIGEERRAKSEERGAKSEERGAKSEERRAKSEERVTRHHLQDRRVAGSQGRRIILHPSSLFLILLAALLIYRFTTNLPRANQRDLAADTGLDPGWAILADEPVLPALIAGDFEERAALEYLQAVWDVAPDIRPTGAGDFGPVSEGEQNDSTSYITRRAVAAAPEAIRVEEMRPQAAGEQLIALWPASDPPLPSQANTVDLDFGDKLQLVGWEQIKTDFQLPANVPRRLPRANWQIALYWQTPARLDQDYTISVRPMVDGQLIMTDDEAIIQDHQPVWGIYPTSQWRPNEPVRDIYALTLPAGVTPDAIRVVVYTATETGFENLAERTISVIRVE